MKTMSLRRKIFYGVTLAFVATLLLLPATGWLARLQLMPWSLRLQLMPWSLTSLTLATYGVNTSEIRHASVLAKSPGDFDLRYAVALSSGGSAATKLEALNREHPKNAQILAALLRYLTAQDNNGSRPEEALLLPPPKEPQKPQEYKPFSNAARVVVLAAEAEAVEPQNGFFPAMAAVALFALREDDKAVAAWVRAGNAPDWNDYTERDATARWKLLRALHGNRETGSVMRMSTTAGGIMFPHYAKLRMAAVTAMQAEIAGNANEGLRIRRATRQVGESLQKQNGSMVGNIVGSAVVSLSAARAGGAEALENPYERRRQSAGGSLDQGKATTIRGVPARRGTT